jgi:myo-inositol-1(or 4)-monophosphatase
LPDTALAWLAQGRLGASITLNNNPWDMAAGVIIARAAGAIVVDQDGAPYTLRSGTTIASAAALLEPVLNVIQEAAEAGSLRA